MNVSKRIILALASLATLVLAGCATSGYWEERQEKDLALGLYIEPVREGEPPIDAHVLNDGPADSGPNAKRRLLLAGQRYHYRYQPEDQLWELFDWRDRPLMHFSELSIEIRPKTKDRTLTRLTLITDPVSDPETVAHLIRLGFGRYDKPGPEGQRYRRQATLSGYISPAQPLPDDAERFETPMPIQLSTFPKYHEGSVNVAAPFIIGAGLVAIVVGCPILDMATLGNQRCFPGGL